MRLRTRVVLRPINALVEDLLEDLRADREAEAEEERVHECVAQAHGAGDDVAVRYLERAAENDEPLKSRY